MKRHKLPSLLCLFLLLFAVRSMAQQGTTDVTGTVMSEKGEILEGVSVDARDTMTHEHYSAMTDSKGVFVFSHLSVAGKYDFTFSFVGYESDVYKGFVVKQDGQKNTLLIRLHERKNELNEVVVTALGVRKDTRKIGYAVQEVKGDELVKARDANPVTGLIGKVAGLSVGPSAELLGTPSILMRGNQITLFVVDGVPISSDTWNISPDDVESYSVLKGPAAAALYGSRAQYGAILITTKKGGKHKGYTVEINSTNSIDKGFIAYPKTQSIYGGGMYGEYAFADGYGGGVQDAQYQLWGPKFRGQLLPQYDGTYDATNTYTTTFGNLTYKGHIVPTPYVARGFVNGKNNLERFLQAGFQSTNNVALTAVGDNYNLRFSLSQSHQNSIVPNTGLDIANFNMYGSYKPNDRLTLNASLNFNRAYTPNIPDVLYGPGSLIYDLSIWTGAEWNVTSPDIEGIWQPGQTNIRSVFPEHVHYHNPWMMVESWLRGHYKTDINGYVSANYKFNSHLNVTGRTQVTTYSLFRSEKMPFSAHPYNRAQEKGDYREDHRELWENNTDIQLNYNYRVHNFFTFSGLAGGSLRAFTYNSSFTSTDYLSVPGIFSFSNSLNPVQSSNFHSDMQVLSAYAAADISVGRYATLSATGRVDKSSALPINHDVYYYPSLSATSVVSDYITLPKVISSLKVRASYATVHGDATAPTVGMAPFNSITAYGGSTAGTLYDNPLAYGTNYLSPYGGPDYSLQQVFSTSKPYNNGPAAAAPQSIFDPNIRTFNRVNYEEGFDIYFLDHRLGFNATAFQYIDGPRILADPVSPATGYTTYYVNGLKTQKNGYELTLSGTPLRTKNFTWEALVNWSTYTEKYKELPGGQSTFNTFYHVGDRVDRLYNLAFARTQDGQVIYDASGLPLRNPVSRFLGNVNPDYTWSVYNKVNYKSFYFSFQFDGSVGGVISDYLLLKTMVGGANIATTEGALGKSRLDDDANAGVSSWKGSYIGQGVQVTNGQAINYDNLGNITNYKSLAFSPNRSTITVQNWATQYYNTIEGTMVTKTFAKLREVVIGYDLPHRWLQKSFINKVSLSLVGRNLLYFYVNNKYRGLDVEQFNTSVSPAIGVASTATSSLQTPTTRRFGFNLNVVF
ncbi:SusC/RagA family TonB-linked outer membrane protein [Puia dinghuensis]|uniref:SusC/RagA family TonB-linked outer membrane protein n=1 Tax=Puia dinghuensis TaxID=1792502 RepID=A0A8J2UCX0_9BACT|nr:SusC/RagA family TonB-linked outer membrane protein [Puia dinghuensis]GGB00035.1 SusC/RagA family TonB-linked outer membrane protein [Puia dinghuensis]